MPAKRKARDNSKSEAGDAKKRNTAEAKVKVSSKLAEAKSQKKTDVPQSYSHWLVKSEPNTRMEKGIDMKFSFEDLKACKNQTSCWDGVRNYQARNFLRDQMKVDHDVFFYHSNCKEPGIVGLCKVASNSYPDHTQFDKKEPHFDGTSSKDNPRWYMVDVKYVRPLERFISLAELKKKHQAHLKSGGPLRNLALFTKARLSVQPLSQEEWEYILQMESSEES